MFISHKFRFVLTSLLAVTSDSIERSVCSAIKGNPLINQIMSVRTVWRFRSTVHSMEKEKLLLGDLLRQAPSLIVPG